MKSEWKECKISDLGTVIGGATPSTKKAENYKNGTISWITPKDLSNFSGRFISHGERNITDIAGWLGAILIIGAAVMSESTTDSL